MKEWKDGGMEEWRKGNGKAEECREGGCTHTSTACKDIQRAERSEVGVVSRAPCLTVLLSLTASQQFPFPLSFSLTLTLRTAERQKNDTLPSPSPSPPPLPPSTSFSFLSYFFILSPHLSLSRGGSGLIRWVFKLLCGTIVCLATKRGRWKGMEGGRERGRRELRSNYGCILLKVSSPRRSRTCQAPQRTSYPCLCQSSPHTPPCTYHTPHCPPQSPLHEVARE